MKVLVIDTVDVAYNGITDCIYQYLKAMDRTGLRIDILAGTESIDEVVKKFQLIGSEVYHIGNRKRNPLMYAWRLGRFVSRNKYDIVHVHGNSATMTFDLLGAKLGGCGIRIAHSHNTTCQHITEDRILRPLFYCLVTDRFACGQKAGEWLFRKRDFKIIPNGRDLQKFSYSELDRKDYRRKLKLEDVLVIGHIGGFNQAKNQKFALEVFAEILKHDRRSKIVFAGEGELLEDVKKYAEELKVDDSSIFLGAISDVNKLLSAIDIMIMPSLHEGMPLVILEAQSEGVPCVLSDSITRECGISDLVKYLPLSEGAEKWAKVISGVKVVNRHEAQERGRRALKREGYDIRENARDLRILYEKLAAR